MAIQQVLTNKYMCISVCFADKWEFKCNDVEFGMDNFFTLPNIDEELLNGHVFFLFTECNRVTSHTSTALKDLSSYKY